MKTFNLIVTGYGGQGILTLAEIIGKVALMEGYDVKQAEIHGLAQRGGTLQCHVRFGEKVYSPLVKKGCADLIISLDALEALRACYYASKERTIVLTDEKILYPIPMPQKTVGIDEILKNIEKFAKKVEIVKASEIVKNLTGEVAMSNIFILGYSIRKGFLLLKKEFALKAIEKRIRPQFLEANKKVFEEAFK